MFKLRPISELTKYDRNPRRITETDLAKLVQSIRDNGEYFNARPIILSDRTGELVIIAGNQRYEAASFLELELVPTYLLSGLTEEKEREILVRDNVANGTFDWDMLANEFEPFDLEAWGVKMDWPSEVEEEAEVPEPIDKPVIKLEYTMDDCILVREALSKIDSSPERAVWQLLFNK